MIQNHIPAPGAGEYAPFYAGYVALVIERDPLDVLRRQVPVLRAACAEMSDTEALARYAPGKWSVKQVLGHIADSERVFAYRLLRVGRGDDTPLAGYDENAYVDSGDFERRSVRSLLQELETVRAGTLSLVETMPAEAWARRGSANGFAVSTRALIFITAGHAAHHIGILRDRYGIAVPETEATD